MPDTVEAPVPVEAGALADARTRTAIGRVLRPRSDPSELAQAVADAKAEARAAGLTDADIDAELEAYNAEHRSTPAV